IRSAKFRPVYFVFFWVFVADCILLGFCGASPAEGIWVLLSRLGTIYYFAHFLVLLPLLSLYERPIDLPLSISSPKASASETQAA
ncbi:MAG: cytochrome b, partial [Alphaproteobacteria bacterium]